MERIVIPGTSPISQKVLKYNGVRFIDFREDALDDIFKLGTEDNIFKDKVVFVQDNKSFFEYVNKLVKSDDNDLSFGANRIGYWLLLKDFDSIFVGTSRFIIAEGQFENYEKKIDYFLSDEAVAPPLKIPEVRYVDCRHAKSYFEYYDRMLTSNENEMVSLDFEANITTPMHEAFHISGFCLSFDKLCTWFDFRYPVNDAKIREEAYKEFEKFMDKHYSRCIVYNCQYEMQALYHLFHKCYEVQDSKALLICDGYNTPMSLKAHAQRMLHVPGWKDKGDVFRDKINELFSYFNTYENFIKAKENNFDSLGAKYTTNEGTTSYLDTDRIRDLVKWLNDAGVDWELVREYWWEDWMCIPTKTLGYYCCLDGFYTKKIFDDLYPKYKGTAYNCFIRNCWLEWELNAGGIPINKKMLKCEDDAYQTVINNCRIMLDQVMIWFEVSDLESKCYHDFEVPYKFTNFMKTFGMSLFDKNFAKIFIEHVNHKKDQLDFDEEALMELIPDNEELRTQILNIFCNLMGEDWDRIRRKRKEFQLTEALLYNYIEFDKIRNEYNRRNMNDYYQKIKTLVNGKRQMVLGKIFRKDQLDIMKLDKFDELYQRVKMCSKVTKEVVDSVACYFIDGADRMTISETITDIVLNRMSLDFSNVPDIDSIYEEKLLRCNKFHDEMAYLLNMKVPEGEDVTDEQKKKAKDQLEGLYKYFKDFEAFIKYNFKKPELESYSDLEDIPITQKVDKITIGMEKIPWKDYGGWKYNYQSPDIKQFFTWHMQTYYYEELAYGEQKYFKYEKDPEYKPKSYEEFMEKYHSDEDYKKWVDSVFWYMDDYTLLFGDCALSSMFERTGIDWNNITINLNKYENKLERMIVILGVFLFQAGMSKEMNGYINGANMGIYELCHPVNKIIDGYYEIGRKHYDSQGNLLNIYTDPRDYVYKIGFQVCEKATKRWSSGFHTMVPHSDTMAVFECQKTPGDEELIFYFDISSAEIRSIAYLSKDPDMMQLFDEGKDVYITVLQIAYPHLSMDEIKAKRKRIKSVEIAHLCSNT